MEMNNTIRLIAEVFDSHGLKYQIQEAGQYQEILVPFGIQNGPSVVTRFISINKGNDTLMRIMSLINKVQEERRYRVLEACNTLNNRYRFLKFSLDSDNDVHVEYDFPISAGDECIGEMAFEIFARTTQILREGYNLIAKTLYAPDEPETECETDVDRPKSLLNLLQGNHDEILSLIISP